MLRVVPSQKLCQYMVFHCRVAPVKHLKVKGEFTVDDLPPIEELQISIPDTVELVSVGKIVTIVESLGKNCLFPRVARFLAGDV